MNAQPRQASGAVVVVAMFVFILSLAGGAWFFTRDSNRDAAFAESMNSGKSYFDSGNYVQAIAAFQKALAMNPANPDVHLNLANGFLRAGQPDRVLTHASEALQLEPGNAAAFYLAGCALLRQGAFSNAVQNLSQAKQIDRTVNAVGFQLGRAYLGWDKLQDAATEFTETLEFEKEHPSAHYQLSQVFLREGLKDEAARELAEHQRIQSGKSGASDDPAVFERCKHTEIIAPSELEQPTNTGAVVRFIDQTETAFGPEATQFAGPLALLDLNQQGWNDLLAFRKDGDLQLLWNTNGTFRSRTAAIRVPTGKTHALIVGDLQNDRFDDAIILGEKGTQVIRFATNGSATDVTGSAGLQDLKAAAGAVVDMDFTGRLGLLVAGREGGRFRVFTNLTSLGGQEILPAVFRERKLADATSSFSGVSQVAVDDWNNDDLPDVFLTRRGQPPALLVNQRASGLGVSSVRNDWPEAIGLAIGDLNGDRRNDLLLITENALAIYFGGLKEPYRIPARHHGLSSVRLLDYDHDGWLDVVAWGDQGLRVWRNRGRHGFHEMTTELGLQILANRPVTHFVAADFDKDGDSDWIVALASGGLRYLRNDGANVNGLLKLHPIGNRSNANGLGIRVELAAGNWHAIRTIQSLPVEIGIGRHTKIDAVTVRWFDNQLVETDVTANPREIHPLLEITSRNTGSCPYLYAWDGHGYRFVTDVLSAAPLGLPAREGVYIEPNPHEWLRLGTEQEFPARGGNYEIRLTEELREVLYLDQVRLVAVDHPANWEAHTTSKLVSPPSFSNPGATGLVHRRSLVSATRLDGTDVTTELKEIDQRRASPPGTLNPQIRGTAVSHGYILDFGELDVSRPWVMALTGWLRFGGGMGNMAASRIADFPNPFPLLDAETSRGVWQRVDVTVGAPAGKTKTILVDLAGKLPAGTRRLRLSESLELHWDCISLWEKPTGPDPTETIVAPKTAHLHWRGFSTVAEPVWGEHVSPAYDQVQLRPPWRITPSGWATRYGNVTELLAHEDNALAIVAGGDELSLSFAASGLPPKPSGMERTFFLALTGWDKDADYHVPTGDQIEPLPWQGQNAQAIGQETRPGFDSDTLHQQYNTRWVGPLTFDRQSARR
ncbi:MAG TPA: FG-GAP-like repeat-containing protein [Candidatus Limnocylindria bacterium]|jgi:Tfp pilus assembly protein PilF|nr:FG-GAP-like repeat-containing protein [Candidatus Limnocylindria bacterium]